MFTIIRIVGEGKAILSGMWPKWKQGPAQLAAVPLAWTIALGAAFSIYKSPLLPRPLWPQTAAFTLFALTAVIVIFLACSMLETGVKKHLWTEGELSGPRKVLLGLGCVTVMVLLGLGCVVSFFLLDSQGPFRQAFLLFLIPITTLNQLRSALTDPSDTSSRLFGKRFR